MSCEQRLFNRQKQNFSTANRVDVDSFTALVFMLFLFFFNTSTVNYPKTNTVDLREIVHLAPLVYSTFRMFEKG